MTQTLTVTKQDGRIDREVIGSYLELSMRIVGDALGSPHTGLVEDDIGTSIQEVVLDELAFCHPSYYRFASSLKAMLLKRRVELKHLRAAVTAIGIFLELHYRRFAEQVGISVFRIVLKPCIVRPNSRSPPVRGKAVLPLKMIPSKSPPLFSYCNFQPIPRRCAYFG